MLGLFLGNLYTGLYMDTPIYISATVLLNVFSPAFVGVAFLDESRLLAGRVQWVLTPIFLIAKSVALFQIIMDGLNYLISLDLSVQSISAYSDEMIWGLLVFTVL